MKIIAAVLVLAALVWVWLAWPPIHEGPPRHDIQAMSEIASIKVACLAYRTVYGTFPTGSLPQVCTSLAGLNPRNVVFIEFHPQSITTNGLFLDPWGTEYRLTFPTLTSVEARCAGKDRQWGTKDDIAGE